MKIKDKLSSKLRMFINKSLTRRIIKKRFSLYACLILRRFNLNYVLKLCHEAVIYKKHSLR